MSEQLKLEDVTDVRVIVQINGKHYALTPTDVDDKEAALAMRKSLLMVLMATHSIVLPALEDIKKR